MSLISSNEVCRKHEIIKARLVQDLQLAKIAAKNRFCPEFWKVPKIKSKNWAHKRPSRQGLAGRFGDFKLFTGLRPMTTERP